MNIVSGNYQRSHGVPTQTLMIVLVARVCEFSTIPWFILGNVGCVFFSLGSTEANSSNMIVCSSEGAGPKVQ